MSEELKIVISAVTDKARKNIQGVKSELGGLEKSGGKAAGGISTAFAAIGTAATAAIAIIGAVVAAVGALIGALSSLSKSTADFRKQQAQLNTAFVSMGGTVEQASKTYKDLYRFLGESDKAVEAASNLAKMTTNEQELSEWTTILQGAFASMNDSIPVEGLAEAANETAKVGKVTGVMADALNWLGVSEDAFNAKLQTLNSTQEREAYIRQTLLSLYGDSAALYEQMAADIIAQNEAQARLDETTARLGKTCQPLQTALTNLSAVCLQALEPAIRVVSAALTWLINVISTAIGWLVKFFSILTGKKATADFASGIASAGKNIGSAGAGAGKLASGLGSANKAAEKLKRTTAGFDELNVISNPNTSSGAGGGGAGGGGVGGLGDLSGGMALDTSGITGPIEEVGGKIDTFVQGVKDAFELLKQLFAPTIQAFQEFGQKVGSAFIDNWPTFKSGIDKFIEGYMTYYNYFALDFIPSVVNAWSTNLLPVFGDISVFAIEEFAKAFEWLSEFFTMHINDIIIPALETWQMVFEGVVNGIKKAWDGSGGALMKNLSKFFEGLRKDTQELYDEIIKPIWDKVIEVFNRVWTDGLKPLWDEFALAIGEITALILQLHNEYVQPFIDFLQETVYPIVRDVTNATVEAFGDFFIGIANAVQGVIQTLKGIVQFVVGIFTGDWEKAWEGIKNIFSGIWKTLANLLKIPLNSIIGSINVVLAGITSAVNVAVKAINKIKVTVPTWVPVYGGKSFGFNLSTMSAPKIPALATGGIVTHETLARIGEGGKKEAVLPLEQNTGWMDMLADKLAAKTNTPSKIVLMLNEKELGWASINSINSITQQTGQLNLNLV